MALEYDAGRRGPRHSASVHAVAVPSAGDEDLSASRNAASLVLSLACAMSGLVMGLALTASQRPLLAFVCGAVLAGGVGWFARALVPRSR